jgi:hypothetical protein
VRLIKILFICSKIQWRSPTTEKIFHQFNDYQVRSAGTEDGARITVTHGHIGGDWSHYHDNKSYFNVLLDDSIRVWVCRLGFNSTNKYIQLNDEKKTFIKIDSVNDIMNYKDEISNVAKQFDKTSTVSY